MTVTLEELTDEERSSIDEWLRRFKNELHRIDCEYRRTDPGSTDHPATPKDYLESLHWVQYEGAHLDHRVIQCNPVLATLLLVAEHLQLTLGFRLLKWADFLVLAHERVVGCAPLDMLAYRPLQPFEADNWLDEDDAIDRALHAIERIADAWRRIDSEPFRWSHVLIGRDWLARLSRQCILPDREATGGG